MKSAALRGGFAAIALIAVAACSAAGGQNSAAIPGSGAGAPAAKAAPAGARHGHASTRLTQRVVAGEALSVVGSSLELDQFGSQNGLLMQILGFGHDVSHRRGRSSHDSGDGWCRNGVESSWSSTGEGQVSQTVEFFYDQDCRHPFNLVTVNASFTQTGGSAQGSQETWDPNGNVLSYQTFSATFAASVNGGIGEIMIRKSTAPAPSMPPTSQSGYTCLFNNGDALDCGSGTTVSLASASPAPEEVGFTETVVGQFVTPGPSGSPSPSPSPSVGPSKTPPTPTPTSTPTPSGTTKPEWDRGGDGGDHGGFQCGPSGLELTINGQGYATPVLGGLILEAGYPPTWSITGGSKENVLTGTAFVGFGGYEHGHDGGWHQHPGGGHDNWGHDGGDPGSGALTSVNLTLNDFQDGLTVTLTSGEDFGSLTGLVTETATAQTVATMSLNYSGNGTITYSNGSVEQVQNWSIVN